MKNTILIFIILATAAICRADSFQPTNFRIADPDAIVQFYLENKEDYPYDLYEVTLGALSIEINDKKRSDLLPIAEELLKKIDIEKSFFKPFLYSSAITIYKGMGDINNLTKYYELYYKNTKSVVTLLGLISESAGRGDFSYLEKYKNDIMEVPECKFVTKSKNINPIRFAFYVRIKTFIDKSPIAKEIVANLESKLLNGKYDESLADDCMIKWIMYSNTDQKDKLEKYLNADKPLLVGKEKERWEAAKKTKEVKINYSEVFQ